MNKEEIIKNLVDASHYISNSGLTPGKSGNISCRFYEDGVSKVAITKSEISKGMVETNDIVIVDMDGNTLEGEGKPSSETFLHLGIYNERNDINAVVHTHSPYAAGFSMSEKELKRLEGFGKIENPYISSVKYSKPGSSELAKDTADIMKSEDAVILKNHGVVAAGISLDEATLLAQFIEDIAKTQFVAHILNL
ncbi:class II aldolase/adducin family protein [Methanobacterium sp. ACI-7]|uniref:class II aldolase/adducin family protein n=1 Tax=unclassified Methanobacterium TaxID=2627676 RepID=UPI0039C2E43F